MENVKLYKQFLTILIVFINLIHSQSITDLEKLRNEYEKIKSSNRLESKDQSSINNIIQSPRMINVAPFNRKDADFPIINETYYFGYDFFKKSDSLMFWDNLPTPSDYVLGPGDEVVLTLWGETQLRKNYTISREGKIYDDKLGLINISGMTVEQALNKLKKQLERVYSTISGNTPSTYIDLSLGALKSINVNFIGNVTYPGVYPIHPFSNLLTGLMQIGGVDTTGSLRDIKIIRNGSITLTIDLYDFFVKGKMSDSLQLKNNDVVVIKSRNSSIIIEDAINKPGVYESLNEETVYDIINYAGGPSLNANLIVGIQRFNESSENIREDSYLNIDDTKLVKAHKKMIITLLSKFTTDEKVEIIGQVKKPGKYNYYKNMKILDLINLSGGFTDSTFLKSVYLDRAELIRRKPEASYEKVFEINLKALISGDDSENLVLQNQDRFVIHANRNFFERKNIEIYGEVNVPGMYPLIYDNESLSSVIIRSGGLTPKALKNGILIYRLNNYYDFPSLSKSNSQFLLNQTESFDVTSPTSNRSKLAWVNSGVPLMPGDSIVVKEKTRTIFVAGAVYNPGILEFIEGKKLKDYLDEVGGINQSGDKKRIIVFYPNGLVYPNKRFNSPKIYDGATIYVNSKAPSETFDLTQFATNWTSIISSMITAIILSRQL